MPPNSIQESAWLKPIAFILGANVLVQLQKFLSLEEGYVLVGQLVHLNVKML